MQITPKFVNPAKEGKKFGSIVGKDETKLMVPAGMVGRFSKGQTYEVTVETRKWGEDSVDVVTEIHGNEKPTYAGNGSGGGDRWYMPFVSNTVAHAIAAGKIEEPDQIGLWAKAAKQAADEL